MTIHIYNRQTIDLARWPATTGGDYARRVLVPLVKHGPRQFIDNVDAEMAVLIAGPVVLPLVIGNPAPRIRNSYVCSPTTHYIDYGKREIEIEFHDRALLRALVAPLLDLLRPLLIWSSFERVVFVNNWLLSTNLYPPLEPAIVQAVRDALVKAFPTHAIAFRSVNDRLNTALLAQLQDLSFRMVFSRQVYILDPQDPSYKRKKSYQKDLSLGRRTQYRWHDATRLTCADTPRLKKLYDELYLKKYSYLNPQFSLRFFEESLRNQWLHFFVLERQGRIDATLGFVERDGVMTTPLIGYDPSVSSTEGLYRLISLKLVEEAAARGLILHQSSGSAAFKRHRGSQPSMEYNLVYDRHLATRRRLPWQLLEALSRGVIPVMERLGL